MEIAEAKALTEALTGKVLPTKREKIAAAGLIVDSLSIHLGVKAAEAFNKYLR